MTRHPLTSLAATALAAIPFLLSGTVDAGCNCRGGGGGGSAVMTPVPMMHAPVMRAPVMHAPMMRAPVMHTPMVAPMVAGPGFGGGACGGSTPPGTLGRTYTLCSRELPEDEHPRKAGLEIRTSDAETIDVENMEGFEGEDGLWHFTTEKPWLPTQPAIVRVVVTRNGTRDVRVVRLIPGRILTVQF